MSNVLIYGPPASGKTSLIKSLGLDESHDLDYLITDASPKRCSTRELIENYGEKWFRKTEGDVLRKWCCTHSTEILALGGGALLDKQTLKEVQKNGDHIICLQSDEDELLARMLSDKSRPLAKTQASAKALLKRRAKHYAQFESKLFKTFHMDLCGEKSDVFVGDNILCMLSSLIKSLMPKCSKLLFICDENASHVGDTAFEFVSSVKEINDISHQFADSTIEYFHFDESKKSLDTVTKVLDAIARSNLKRDDVVISVGGGVCSDIVGLAASLWKRGIEWINIPTTLLSMCDATIGGKTGVDYNGIKNLIGTFHQPRVVIADVKSLAGLPPREARNGIGEIVKHYIIDPTPFRDLTSLASIVAASLEVKVRIVQHDPHEKTGERIKLNLGHTIAHAIETMSNFKVPHGEAVMSGIAIETAIASKNGEVDQGFANMLSEVLKAYGVATEIEDLIGKFSDDEKTSKFINVIRTDKKNDMSGKTTIIVPRDFGDIIATTIEH